MQTRILLFSVEICFFVSRILNIYNNDKPKKQDRLEYTECANGEDASNISNQFVIDFLDSL